MKMNIIKICKNTKCKIDFFFILQAYIVLGQYLVFKKDEQRFNKWLKDTCGANAKQQEDCHQCIKGWCENFLRNPLTSTALC